MINLITPTKIAGQKGEEIVVLPNYALTYRQPVLIKKVVMIIHILYKDGLFRGKNLTKNQTNKHLICLLIFLCLAMLLILVLTTALPTHVNIRISYTCHTRNQSYSWIVCCWHLKSSAHALGGVSGVASFIPLMNSFNKTKEAFFLVKAMLSLRAFPFISFIGKNQKVRDLCLVWNIIFIEMNSFWIEEKFILVMYIIYN